MRKTADLPRNLVKKRRIKELKRETKRKRLGLLPKVSGNLRAGGFWGANRWTGLTPRKIEGFVLYLRGIKITKKNWPYKELQFGERMRMV